MTEECLKCPYATDECETHYNACQKQWFVDECQKEMELEEYKDD